MDNQPIFLTFKPGQSSYATSQVSSTTDLHLPDNPTEHSIISPISEHQNSTYTSHRTSNYTYSQQTNPQQQQSPQRSVSRQSQESFGLKNGQSFKSFQSGQKLKELVATNSKKSNSKDDNQSNSRYSNGDNYSNSYRYTSTTTNNYNNNNEGNNQNSRNQESPRSFGIQRSQLQQQRSNTSFSSNYKPPQYKFNNQIVSFARPKQNNTDTTNTGNTGNKIVNNTGNSMKNSIVSGNSSNAGNNSNTGSPTRTSTYNTTSTYNNSSTTYNNSFKPGGTLSTHHSKPFQSTSSRTVYPQNNNNKYAHSQITTNLRTKNSYDSQLTTNPVKNGGLFTKQQCQQLAKTVMDLYDGDNDGICQSFEVGKWLVDCYRAMNKHFTPTATDIASYVHIVDINKNGKISREELEQFIMNYFLEPQTQ